MDGYRGPYISIATIYLQNGSFCEAQARVRQGLARDGSQGKRPQSLNPSLELTLKLGCHLPPPPPPEVSLHLPNEQEVAC